jgi:hypothetical protein
MIADAEMAMKQLGVSVGGSEPVATPREAAQTHKKQRKDGETSRPTGRKEGISKRGDAKGKVKTQARQAHTSKADLDRKS